MITKEIFVKICLQLKTQNKRKSLRVKLVRADMFIHSTKLKSCCVLVLIPCLIPCHRCEKSARESRNSHQLITQHNNIHGRTHDMSVDPRDICRMGGTISSKNTKIVPYHGCARIPRRTVSVPDHGSR